jgi:hypothetical protein
MTPGSCLSSHTKKARGAVISTAPVYFGQARCTQGASSAATKHIDNNTNIIKQLQHEQQPQHGINLSQTAPEITDSKQQLDNT